MVQDLHGRPLSNLRISLNQACNLKCSYCHLEGGAMVGGGITPEEWQTLCGLAAELGVTSLKITGGEPTLRTDLPDILRRVAPLFDDVSMTTNGLTLDRLAPVLKEAGLNRVNVSMDTLDQATYERLTGGGNVDRVIAGIDAAIQAGIQPIKVNMVVIRGVNDTHIEAMETFTAERGIGLQLIELHTDRENACGVPFRESFVSLHGVEANLEQRADRIEVAPQHGRKRYFVPHMVEVVRPYGNADFCSSCFRLRITGDGHLKPCLMRTDNHLDAIGPLRAGASRDELRALFLEANQRREPYWPAQESGSALVAAGQVAEHRSPNRSGFPALPVLP